MKKPEISETMIEDLLKSPKTETKKAFGLEEIKLLKWVRVEENSLVIITGGLTEKEKKDVSIDTQKASDFFFYFKKWKQETAGLSSPSSIRMNRNYQKIIGLGPTIIPLILRELEREADDWLYALEILVKDEENPTTEDMGFNESVSAWLNWGKKEWHI